MALVLIMVDQPETLLTWELDLEAGGHTVVLAADADTALERLGAHPIDVVVLDLTMSARDGWTVLDALRRQLRAPAIVISGWTGPDELDRASRLGPRRRWSSPPRPRRSITPSPSPLGPSRRGVR